MKWIGWTAGLLGVVTAIAGVNLALLNYTPIPFADQIDFFRGFYKVDGWEGYSFKQLYVRHNEHRILVPRLWFLADIAWFDGRQILTIGTILVSAVLHAVLLTALFRGLGQRGWVVMVFLLMAVGAVLSPVQWENLIWGFQVQFIQVWLFATLAFALIAWTPLAEKHGVLRGSMILFALLAAFASTYSMVNGLLVWPLLLLLAWWRRLPTWAVALIGLIGGAVIAVEVTGFSVHAGHGDPRDTLLQPLGLVRYAARYLMSSASAIGPLGQEILGGLLMAYTLVMALWSLLQRDRFRPSHGALLAVAGFIVGAAFLTGLGRLPFGLDQASGSRYATPSLVFLLAVSALILHQIRSYDRRRWHALALGFGSILLLLPGLVDGSKVLPTLIGQRDARKNAVSAYLVSGYQPDTLSAIYPGWPAIPQRVFDQLFADGIGPFAVSEQFKPRAVLGDRIPLPVKACRGYVDGASYDPVGGVRVIGWAAAKESIDQPIWVLVTDRRDRIVAWGPSGVRRDDVGAAIDNHMAAAIASKLPSFSTGATFFDANSQAHHKPLSAFGDLADNAENAGAKLLSVDVEEKPAIYDDDMIITMTDNGHGMSEHKLRTGFGGIAHSDKGDRAEVHYGMGAKSALPRLGRRHSASKAIRVSPSSYCSPR